MSIATERAALFAQGLDIVHRETWGARQPYTSTRPVEKARWLFLHIAVIRPSGDEATDMRNIEAIGQARFGIGCSYNAAAFQSGRLHEAQPLGRRGAHTVNDKPNRAFPYHADGRGYSLNHLVRALVLPQDVENLVTDAQVDAAARWAGALIRAGLAVPGAVWYGHRDVTQKSCPGPIAYARLTELNRLTRHYEAHGLTAPTSQEDDMPPTARLIRSTGAAEVYLTDNYVTRRKVGNEARLADLLTLNNEHPFLASTEVRVVSADFIDDIPVAG